ncbi:hypothetical protein ABZS86_03405 [Streptomyces sp. NPDC005355]
MRTHTTNAAAVVATTLLLTGCSTSDGRDKPTPAGASASATEAALSKAEIIRRCVDAIADRAAATKGGAVRSEPVPKPCVPLSDADYLDAYLEGLHQATRAAQDQSQDGVDKAADGTGS